MTRSAITRGGVLAALALLSVVLWGGRASAGVIPPGREAVVQELVAAAIRASGAPAPSAIVIDREVVRLRYDDGVGVGREIVVQEPGTAAGPMPLAEGVRVVCTPECTATQLESSRALAVALSAERASFAERLWTSPPARSLSEAEMARDAGERTERSRLRRREIGTWLVLAYVLAWGAATALGAARRADRRLVRELAPAAAIVVISAIASLTLTERMPVHDHLSFVGRSDCAFSGECDDDPRGAWSPPTFHVYALLLRLLPYRVENLALLSTALHALSLTLMFLFTRRLFRRFGGQAAGRRTALAALAMAALHPLAIRLAASDTFWPYALACLWGAGYATLAAVESGKTVDALAAAMLLGLAMCTNKVFLVLGPLAVLAPLAWTRPSADRVRAGPAFAVLAATAFVAPAFLATLRGVSGSGPGPTQQRVLEMARRLVEENLYLDPRLTPTPVALLLALGLVVCFSRRFRATVPILYAYFATEMFLANQVELFKGYPTRFIHGYASLQLLALFAAVGAERLRAALGAGAVALVLAGSIAVLVPTATESIAFLRGHRTLSAELHELSRAFDQLPAHDVLVVPPVIQPPLGCTRMDSDPVEAFFPQGEYAYVLRSRGLPKTTIVELEELLARPEQYAGLRALFYLGSTYRTFLRCEIESGTVPQSLDRPTLDEVRRRFRLEPALVFRVPAVDHPAVAMRLGADRVPDVEAGFYWLRPR